MAVECNPVHLVLILSIFTTLTIMGKRFGDAGLIDVADGSRIWGYCRRFDSWGAGWSKEQPCN